MCKLSQREHKKYELATVNQSAYERLKIFPFRQDAQSMRSHTVLGKPSLARSSYLHLEACHIRRLATLTSSDRGNSKKKTTSAV